MKRLFAIAGVAALLCGCHTHNQGGTSDTYDSSTGTQMRSGDTNNATQGSAAGRLSNTNSAQPDSTQPSGK